MKKRSFVPVFAVLLFCLAGPSHALPALDSSGADETGGRNLFSQYIDAAATDDAFGSAALRSVGGETEPLAAGTNALPPLGDEADRALLKEFFSTSQFQPGQMRVLYGEAETEVSLSDAESFVSEENPVSEGSDVYSEIESAELGRLTADANDPEADERGFFAEIPETVALALLAVLGIGIVVVRRGLTIRKLAAESSRER